MAEATYDDIEYVLAEVITEATGESRVGRFERTLAKSALRRLREMGMTLNKVDADRPASFVLPHGVVPVMTADTGSTDLESS